MYRTRNTTVLPEAPVVPAAAGRGRHRVARERRGPWTAAPRARVRVGVEADEPVLHAGLVALVDAAPGLQLADAAPGTADRTAPGIEVRVRAVGAPSGLDPAGPAPLVVVVLELTDAAMLELLRAGVGGLLLQASVVDLLEPAVRSAAAGGCFLDPALVPRLAAMADRGRRTVRPDELTVQERRVLRLVASDLSNRAIAAALGVSVHTVKAHVRSASRKLGASDRYGAVATARSRGALDEV